MIMHHKMDLSPHFVGANSLTANRGRRAGFIVCVVTSVCLIFIMVAQALGRFELQYTAYPLRRHSNNTVLEMYANQTNLGKLAPTPIDAANRSETLAVATQILVVSLPYRQDRRDEMEVLRSTLGLRWTFVEGVGSQSPSVQKIMQRVKTWRDRRTSAKLVEAKVISDTNFLSSNSSFRWPLGIDALATSHHPLEPAGSELWSPPSPETQTPRGINSHLQPLLRDTADDKTLTCATKDDVNPPFEPSLPDHKILTAAKVACWSSHVSAIRLVVEVGTTNAKISTEHVSIILEDDVDMEWDIQDRLSHVWPLLPAGWDIVFLGHCWSNESHFDALGDQGKGEDSTKTTLHPSFAPKCTHAYALSQSGARRLLLHLRHPPFAYSRALDQAFSWLVRSGRIRAYSLVPSVVVQRKIGISDVMRGGDGLGSQWKVTLFHGVFGT